MSYSVGGKQKYGFIIAWIIRLLLDGPSDNLIHDQSLNFLISHLQAGFDVLE
jgi:hypothetical protein